MYHYFDQYHYFDRLEAGFAKYDDSDSESKTSFIYYVMCLEARFYDYLATSEVKKKLSSKLVTITFAS